MANVSLGDVGAVVLDATWCGTVVPLSAERVKGVTPASPLVTNSNITRPTGQFHHPLFQPVVHWSVGWQFPIVCFFFIHFLQGFSVILYLNIFITDLYEKMPKAKKIFKTFLEDHIGISIFFSLLSTGIQSFVVHIGSGGEGKVEFEPKISLLGLLFLTTIFLCFKSMSASFVLL